MDRVVAAATKPTPRTQVATRPSPPKVVSYRNPYLSVSRIRKYAQCPQAFRFSYVDKRPRGTNENLAFGSLLHLALEAINRWAVKSEHVGSIDDETIVRAFFNDTATTEIYTEDLYQEGLDVLREWFRVNIEIDSTRVLGIEQKFTFEFEGRTFLGYIDRIDKLDDETVLVRDYKSNRIVFTSDETEADVQLSVYAHAVRLLYPWVKNVELAFDMLRHARTLQTSRTQVEVDDALRYCVDVADKSEADTEFKPCLNVFCAWCDHLDSCEAFKQALSDKQEFVAITQDDELEAIAAERERLVLIGKAVDGKRKALDRLISARLKAADEPSVTAAGITYKLASKSSRVYDVDKTVDKLVKFAKVKADDARKAVLTVSSGALDRYVKTLGLSRPAGKILKANLDSVCDRVSGSRYVDARPVKGTKK
jgi:RecB family exonuclease